MAKDLAFVNYFLESPWRSRTSVHESFQETWVLRTKPPPIKTASKDSTTLRRKVDGVTDLNRLSPFPPGNYSLWSDTPKCSEKDLNLHQSVRSRPFYPLNYPN